jgi:phosphoadenosine phosphosulfate reductase
MYSFSHSRQKNVDIYKIYGDILNDLLFAIKRIANKAAYCIKCGACEALCYHDALSFKNKKIINQKNCIHCLACLNFIEKGCWVALSIRDTSGGNHVKNAGNMDRYAGFGLRKVWLVQFLEKGSAWDGSGLGNKQIDSMKRWLQDSELWDKSTKKLSELGKLFVDFNKPNDLFVWSVIWFNLGFEGNSPLIRWYTLELQKGDYQKRELLKKLAEYRGQSEANRTDVNAISALCNLFEKSPIGNELEMGKAVTTENKKEKIYHKGSNNNIPDLSVLYAIYKYAEKQQRKHLVASELITTNDSTPFLAFGLEYNSIKAILVKIASKYPDLLYVEFSGNLDNINLSKEKTSIDVIRIYITNNP